MDHHRSLSPTVLGEQAYLRAAMDRIAALLQTPRTPKRQVTLRQEARWAAERLGRLPGAGTPLGHRIRRLLNRLQARPRSDKATVDELEFCMCLLDGLLVGDGGQGPTAGPMDDAARRLGIRPHTAHGEGQRPTADGEELRATAYDNAGETPALPGRQRLDGPTDLRASLGIASTAFVVGYLGRLSYEKKVCDLISAFAGSCADYLLIGGWGIEEPALRRQVQDLGLEDRVVFAGVIHDPASFYEAIDIFALVSESEGMPLSVAEAMMAGLPVVASSVGAVPEMLRHGEAGLLVHWGDIEGIRVAIDRLRRDPRLAASLAAAAQAIAGERSWVVEVGKIERVWARLHGYPPVDAGMGRAGQAPGWSPGGHPLGPAETH